MTPQPNESQGWDGQDPAKGTYPVSLRLAAWLAVLVLAALGVGLTLGRSAPPSQEPVIVAAWDLPAYTTLDAQHLVTETAAPPPGAVISLEEALGRVITQPVAAGTVLRSRMLISPTRSIAHSWLLTLPISTTVRPVPGETVILLGLEEGAREPSFTVEDAVALDVRGGQVVVALPPTQARQVAAYLVGRRRLLVLRAVPR